MTLLGKILAILNVLAALAFGVLLLLDYGKRQQWSYAVFLYDVRLQGLPLEQDNLDPSIPRDRVLSRHLDEQTLKTVFAGAGEPVKTLEEEVQKLQGRLSADVEAAVPDVAAKFGAKDDDKRNGLRYVLLPLARTGPQIDALEEKIKNSKGPALDALVQEAVRRHILNDLLDPLQQLSPAQVKDDLTPRIAELDAKGQFAVPLAKLDEFVSERLRQVNDPKFMIEEGQKEWNREQRRQIVTDLIYAVDHLTKPRPDGKLATELLNEQGPGRALVVLGLVQYDDSTGRYAGALGQITRRMVAAIEADRDGVKGKLPGFVNKYREQVATLRRLAEDAKDRQRLVDDLKAQGKDVADDLAERKAHHDAVVKKIMDSRAETLKLAQELRQMQQQLFVAQRDLSTAFEDNLRLLGQIRALEGLKKGAQ